MVYSKEPGHRVAPPDAKKHYDFWAQFVAIQDDTGNIGANITYHDEEDKLKNGQIVVIKGLVHKYEDAGEEKVVLNKATIVKPEKPKEESTSTAKDEKIAKVDNTVNVPTSSEGIRIAAITVAFDFGAQNNISIY